MSSCESCGRGADVTGEFLGAEFTLCVPCVLVEDRPKIVAIAGHEDSVEDLLGCLDDIQPRVASA